jgi:dipeptidyl aminopeptidase/acylaminoacyl peptidase
MGTRLDRCLIVLLAALATSRALGTDEPANTSGQTVSAEVYARAAALMGPNLIKHVFNYFVVPHWIGATDQFWYRDDFEGGHQFLVVDARTGRKQPAFDHEAVAVAVGTLTGKPAAARDLPFSEFTFSEHKDAIDFKVADALYSCQLQPVHCDRRAPEAPADGILVSPNGRYGVETRSDNNLWLHDLKSGRTRALTSSGAPDYGWGFYPDDRADYVPRLYSGKPQLPANTQWAPDSRLVLVPLIDQRQVESYPFVESKRKDAAFRPRVHQIRIPLVGEHPPTFVWYLIDVETGEPRRIQLPYDKLILIQQDFIAVRDLFWSKDSRRLYMVAHGDNLQSGYLFEVDTGTGKVRTIIEESGSPRMEFNSTTYNAVNVRVIRDGKEAIWWSQRDGWGHLYRYDATTGKLLNRITSGKWLVREIISVDERRGRIFFTAGGSRRGNPYYRHLYRVNLDGSELKLLTPEDADHLLLPDDKGWVLQNDGIVLYPPLSPSRDYVAYNYSRVDLPTHFAIRRVSDGGLVAEVTQADAAGLRLSGWRAPEEFKVLAPDGKSELWGTIYKPSDFDLQKVYPVIDSQYASPLWAIVPRNFYQAFRGQQPLAPSSYAELGFIVVTVDARGTTYRSKEFSQYGFGQLNLIGLGDHVHAIKELARTRPWMDLERVGIIGHSYGGYTVVRAMLEFPEFFKVGISSAGPADMEAMYNDYHWTAYHGKPRYENGTEWMGSDKTEVPGNWKNVAASLQADRLKGKLLIQFGELDENVPPGSVFRFIDALIAANKDFDMLYLPGRNHQFIGEGYVVRRDWDYMVRHLAGKEPPPDFELQINGR